MDSGVEFFFEVTPNPTQATRPAVQFDAGPFATGQYAFTHTFSCHFPISRRSSPFSDRVIVQNETQSPFGAGWTLAGLHKLYQNDDGSLLLTMGNHSAWVYQPDLAGGFLTPSGDFAISFNTPTAASPAPPRRGGAITSMPETSSPRWRTATATRPPMPTTPKTGSTNDRLTEVRAPNGVLTCYAYDVLGRVTSETSPDRGTITYSYDLANNLTGMTDARGITVLYSRDALDRMISRRYPDPGEDVTYTYDTCPFGVGRLCGRIDESGQYAYAYDAFGNVIEMIRTELGIPYTTSYEYDEGDRVIAMTLPTGRAVIFTRDGMRRIERIETSIDDTPTPVLASSTYQADNQITSRTYGNGLMENANLCSARTA